MSKPIRSFEYEAATAIEDVFGKKISIEELQPGDSQAVVGLIRENMREFDQEEKVLSTIYRRLENFSYEYSREGSSLYVVKSVLSHEPIACIGIGSFQGLPWTERIGEIRDLVVQKNFRSQGLGQKLLKKILLKAKELEYKRLYLEISKHMRVAQKLFGYNGFQPVEHLPKEGYTEKMPCYFLLTDLNSQDLSEA